MQTIAGPPKGVQKIASSIEGRGGDSPRLPAPVGPPIAALGARRKQRPASEAGERWVFHHEAGPPPAKKNAGGFAASGAPPVARPPVELGGGMDAGGGLTGAGRGEAPALRGRGAPPPSGGVPVAGRVERDVGGQSPPGGASGSPWKDREQRNPPPFPQENGGSTPPPWITPPPPSDLPGRANIADTGRPSSELSRVYRAEVYGLRDGLRRYAPAIGRPGGRLRACGRVRVGGEVAIVERGGRCHYCGLVRCGSVWSCPCCSAQIRAERAGEVQRVVAWHVEGAGVEGAQLLTLTVRHRYGDELAALRQGLANAYRRFTRGEPWLRFRERVGFVGSVRALEVTHGGNGWHPHLHVALLVNDGAALADELDWLSERWQACVVRELGTAAEPNERHGVDLRPCYRADYSTKLGLEVTAPSGKGARDGNRTPWQIAADLCALPHAHDERSDEEIAEDRATDVYLWQTWSEDMRGARMLTWSRGLREAAALGEEKTDEEIVEGDGENDRTVALVPAGVWDRVRQIPGVAAQVLAVAETEGAAGVALYLAPFS